MTPARLRWLLPLLCAVLPVVAVHWAWWLSRAAGYIPDCIPHLEGCTSISRAARHGAGNAVFKLLMLPAAFLQAWHWRRCADWLDANAGRPSSRGLRQLGVVAGVALAVYAMFLGTEGPAYGWLRRYGIVFYFAGTFCAMVVFLRGLQHAPVDARWRRSMLALCFTMLALGLASVFAPLFIRDALLEDRFRDVLEWWIGGLFTAWFLLHAAMAARTRGRPPRPPS